MIYNSRLKSWAIWFAVMFLLLIFFIRELNTVKAKSATCDETPHIAAGYSYLKANDYKMNYEHPPLCKLLAAIPLQFINLHSFFDSEEWSKGDQWNYGIKFLNHNVRPISLILLLSRIPIVLLGMLLGIFVFLWTKQVYGFIADY